MRKMPWKWERSSRLISDSAVPLTKRLINKGENVWNLYTFLFTCCNLTFWGNFLLEQRNHLKKKINLGSWSCRYLNKRNMDIPAFYDHINSCSLRGAGLRVTERKWIQKAAAVGGERPWWRRDGIMKKENRVKGGEWMNHGDKSSPSVISRGTHCHWGAREQGKTAMHCNDFIQQLFWAIRGISWDICTPRERQKGEEDAAGELSASRHKDMAEKKSTHLDCSASAVPR